MRYEKGKQLGLKTKLWNTILDCFPKGALLISGDYSRSNCPYDGFGMGCPDWPKCFGYYLPPTNGKQLLFKPNHSYKKGMMILMDHEQFMVAKKTSQAVEH